MNLEQLEQIIKENKNLSKSTKEILLGNNIKKIIDTITEVWVAHAQLEETLSLLIP